MLPHTVSRANGSAIIRYRALQVVRCLPWVVNNYKLDEVTTVPELRSNVAKLFKLHAKMQNPAVRLLLSITFPSLAEAYICIVEC